MCCGVGAVGGTMNSSSYYNCGKSSSMGSPQQHARLMNSKGLTRNSGPQVVQSSSLGRVASSAVIRR